MRSAPREEGVLGIFEHSDSMMHALRQARERQLEVRDVYTPVPDEAVLEFLSPRRSPVRFVTFTGAITGLVSGMALAIGTSLVWSLVVGGKPVTSIIPFLVVGFELTILLGALATLGALLLFGGLPFRKFPSAAYRSEFTNDRFGVWLGGSGEAVEASRRLLEEAGAVEVLTVGAEGRS
jgi:molybdopterin-containing oxidoreductase family membrane subunit